MTTKPPTKVFGIGFHKTGTTTLERALEILGFSVIGPKKSYAKYLFRNQLEPIMEKAEQYDAAQDNPWPLCYAQLDQKFPGSKFVLTIREEEKWIKSVVGHFGLKDTLMREYIYGVGHPLGNEDVYLDRYRKHNREVLEYFKDRQEDLLVVDWSSSNGWSELCSFLGAEVPAEEFPHANKRRVKNPEVKKVEHFFRKVFKSIRKK